MLLIGIGFFSLNATQQTASRLTWSLARDNSLVFSSILSRVHPTLQVPVWALVANFVVIFMTGLIYVGSSTGTGFSSPPVCHLADVRSIQFACWIGDSASAALIRYTSAATDVQKALGQVPSQESGVSPPPSPRLDGKRADCHFGAAMDGIFPVPLCAPRHEIYNEFECPLILLVQASLRAAEYLCAVLGVMAVLTAGNWLLHARRHYQGPRIQRQGTHHEHVAVTGPRGIMTP